MTDLVRVRCTRVTSSPAPTFVVAGDYLQFTLWCREVLEMHTDQAVNLGAKFVRAPLTFQGQRDFDIVYYGTYQQRRDIEEIRQAAYVCGARNEQQAWDEGYEETRLKPGLPHLPHLGHT